MNIEIGRWMKERNSLLGYVLEVLGVQEFLEGS